MEESKPVLWDKPLDVFKYRNATIHSWSEVYLALKPDFDVIDNKDEIFTDVRITATGQLLVHDPF